jgi:hypothetical protein
MKVWFIFCSFCLSLVTGFDFGEWFWRGRGIRDGESGISVLVTLFSAHSCRLVLWLFGRCAKTQQSRLAFLSSSLVWRQASRQAGIVDDHNSFSKAKRTQLSSFSAIVPTIHSTTNANSHPKGSLIFLRRYSLVNELGFAHAPAQKYQQRKQQHR